MKLFLSALLAGVTFLTLNAESRLQLHSAKFTVGDDIAWKYKSIDNSRGKRYQSKRTFGSRASHSLSPTPGIASTSLPLRKYANGRN